jgi:PTH1 family peptidyl-tRNA hydrolase
MRLLVGLGNPGSRYAGHRHNLGFMAIDAVARRHGAAGFRSRFKGEIADAPIGGERRLLLKPQTYMNDSGESVAETARFFKIAPAEIAVIHDEIDLRPGKLRVKRGGGNAGHNGLRSIDALLGPDYWRVRIGVGHPGVRELVQPYLLHDFAAEELTLWVKPLLAAVAETIALLLSDMPHAFMSEVARRFRPPDPEPDPELADGAARY